MTTHHTFSDMTDAQWRELSNERPSDYAGYLPGAEGNYLNAGIGHHRDSDLLDESNYKAALEDLQAVELSDASKLIAEAMDHGPVFEMNAGHWAVGWVEGIWIAPVPELMEAVRNIHASLAEYPVLNEEDHSARELEDLTETINDAVRDAMRDLDLDLEADEVEQLQALVMSQDANGNWSRGDDVDYSIVQRAVAGYTGTTDKLLVTAIHALRTQLKQVLAAAGDTVKTYERHSAQNVMAAAMEVIDAHESRVGGPEDEDGVPIGQVDQKAAIIDWLNSEGDNAPQDGPTAKLYADQIHNNEHLGGQA